MTRQDVKCYVDKSELCQYVTKWEMSELGNVACALSVAMVMVHAAMLRLEDMFGNVLLDQFPTWTAHVEVKPLKEKQKRKNQLSIQNTLPRHVSSASESE